MRGEENAIGNMSVKCWKWLVVFTLSFFPFLPVNAGSLYLGLVGKEITLCPFKANESILVAVDDRSFDRMVEAVSSGDKKTLLELLSKDKIFEVWGGTKARILTVISARQKMRINVLEGRHEGKSGWIQIHNPRGAEIS